MAILQMIFKVQLSTLGSSKYLQGVALHHLWVSSESDTFMGGLTLTWKYKSRQTIICMKPKV